MLLVHSGFVIYNMMDSLSVPVCVSCTAMDDTNLFLL